MRPSAVGLFIRMQPSHASSTVAPALRIAKTHNSFWSEITNRFLNHDFRAEPNR